MKGHNNEDTMLSNVRGYSPFPDSLYMKQSSIHGMGLFAKTALPKGTELGITHVADKRFADGYIRTPLGAFINHSVTPNCELYDDQDVIRVRTIQDIPEGEELTLDYTPHYTADTLKRYN